MISSINTKFNSLINNIKLFIFNPHEFFECNPHIHDSNISFYIITIITVLSKTIIYISTNDEPLSEYEVNNFIPGLGYHNLPLRVFIIKLIFSLMGIYISIWIVSYFYTSLIKVFKGECSYTKMTSIYALSYIILNINQIFEAIYTFFSRTTVDLTANTFKDALLNSLSIFMPWQMLFLVLSISAISTLSKKKSTCIVLIMFFLTLSFNTGKQLAVNKTLYSLNNVVNSVVNKYKINSNFSTTVTPDDQNSNKDLIKTPIK